jgi:EAL domain-containing protein (putative c-di-GMP-specific phosphodiesterase class I)
VETEAQKDFLAAHGCTAYQGYLFGPPLTLDRFVEFMGGKDWRIASTRIGIDEGPSYD